MKNRIKIIVMFISIFIVLILTSLKTNEYVILPKETLENCEYETELSTETISIIENENIDIVNENNLITYFEKFIKIYPNSNKALTAYKNFLENKLNAISKSNEEYIFKDLYENKDDRYNKDLKYALLDINNDNLPELLIHSMGRYDIYSYKNNTLLLWNEMHYYYDRLLENKNFMYIREGAAPKHINYIYKVFDDNGALEYSFDFSKYDANENELFDENDAYFIEDIQISKNEWELKTRELLKIKEYEILWNKMECSNGVIIYK